MSHDTHGAHGASDELHHEPLPLKLYLAVAGALLVLTVITVWIAQFHFGEWNLIVAMVVASIKASLVVLYFMNLRYDHDRLNAVVFVSAVLFLIIYFTFTLADTFTRGKVDPERWDPAPIESKVVKDAGGGASVP